MAVITDSDLRMMRSDIWMGLLPRWRRQSGQQAQDALWEYLFAFYAEGAVDTGRLLLAAWMQNQVETTPAERAVVREYPSRPPVAGTLTT